MVLASSFVPAAVSVNTASQGHAPRRANNLPIVSQVFFSSLFSHRLPPGGLPSFSPGVALMPLDSPSVQLTDSLKLQMLSLSGCKNSQNSTLLAFQANGHGEMFSISIPLCAPLSCPSP